MFKRILVAIDGSETSTRALDTAGDLASASDADLFIVHVHLHGRPVEELQRMAEVEHLVPEINAAPNKSATARGTLVQDILFETNHHAHVVHELGEIILRRAEQQARDAGVKNISTILKSGDYADQILEALDDTGADLVVIGRRGLGKISQLVLGSVSNKVVQQAGEAVLIVR